MGKVYLRRSFSKKTTWLSCQQVASALVVYWEVYNYIFSLSIIEIQMLLNENKSGCLGDFLSLKHDCMYLKFASSFYIK